MDTEFINGIYRSIHLMGMVLDNDKKYVLYLDPHIIIMLNMFKQQQDPLQNTAPRLMDVGNATLLGYKVIPTLYSCKFVEVK